MSPFEADPESVPVPVPRHATRIDWADVARLLAAGWTTAEVARHVGCTRQHVWRILRRSPALQQAILEAQRETRLESGSLFAALQPRIAKALSRAVDEGNPRVILWLAERLCSAAPSYTDALKAKGAAEGDDPLGRAALAEREDEAETPVADRAAAIEEIGAAALAACDSGDARRMIGELLRLEKLPLG